MRERNTLQCILFLYITRTIFYKLMFMWLRLFLSLSCARTLSLTHTFDLKLSYKSYIMWRLSFGTFNLWRQACMHCAYMRGAWPSLQYAQSARLTHAHVGICECAPNRTYMALMDTERGAHDTKCTKTAFLFIKYNNNKQILVSKQNFRSNRISSLNYGNCCSGLIVNFYFHNRNAMNFEDKLGHNTKYLYIC